MYYTTFKLAKEHGACIESYRKMAKELGGIRKYGLNTPIPLDKVLDVLGLDDALWCLQAMAEPCDREARLLACDYAEHVLYIYELEYPDDNRVRNCIEISRKYADGQTTREELIRAEAAATAAAEATTGAAASTRAAIRAAAAATAAAWAETGAEAAAAAWAAAGAAASTRAAAADEAGELQWQKGKFIEIIQGGG